MAYLVTFVVIIIFIDLINGLSIGEKRYNTRFQNVGLLFEGEASSERLKNSHVCIIGLGGVGSWVVESLARSGVGALTIVDADDVCESNINRQVLALSSTVGQMKADVLKHRVLDINPDCNVRLMHKFVTPDTVDDVFHDLLSQKATRNVSFVAECVDSVRDKAAILNKCAYESLPVVSCGGAGDLWDPSLLTVSDMVGISVQSCQTLPSTNVASLI